MSQRTNYVCDICNASSQEISDVFIGLELKLSESGLIQIADVVASSQVVAERHVCKRCAKVIHDEFRIIYPVIRVPEAR